ncbi:MAG: hypothetical protein IT379_26580 [Deltaproteobacteria bacterium]|nr:hypothetical protein [Deltaproteobacteria bacterium]
MAKRTTKTGGVRWIAVGGGSEPSSNQVSLEQDLELAARTFEGEGIVLFAGGAGQPTVQELRPDGDVESARDALRARLGALFDARAGRDARYRPTRLSPDGPATLEALEQALDAALAEPAGRGPLLVYAALHGDSGDAPRDGVLSLWGGFTWSAAELAERLDAAASRRRVRLLIAACYSGGFAEVVFRGANEEAGAANGDRCGLFAAPWDQESSGCDPDPDRRRQQSYSLHVLMALGGRGRDGQPLPRETIDLDGDGAISLLEAHTRARIASRSIDVPTTTSERWLRSAAPEHGPSIATALPEEDAVVRSLGETLALRTEDAARARLARLEDEQRVLDERIEALSSDADERAADLRVALLSRWPVLDDPWHRDFAPLMAAHEEAIRRAMDEWPEAAAWTSAQAALDAAAERADTLTVDLSIVRRLVRAHETRTLAARLHAVGGEAWQTYERILRCERSAP